MNTDMPITICKDCVECNQDGPPWYWTCQRHIRVEGFGFVTRDEWPTMPPRLYCHHVNGGACPLFKLKKEIPDAENE